MVDAPEYWKCLQEDILSARDRVWVEVMSFEADSAGLGLERTLLRSPAPDRRVLVDSYTRFSLSDRFAFSPRFWLDAGLREEARETERMMERLRRGGVEVRFTNEIRINPLSLFCRNHKKLVLIDSTVAYVGGINFSDHNFRWHDFMLRLDRRDLAADLAEDFSSTWTGRNLDRACRSGDVELLSLDGLDNDARFQPVLQSLRSARDSIWVESPYLSLPFYSELAAARRRGVAVTLVTPSRNNKGIMDEYTIWEANRAGIELRRLPEMTHLKAMVIDGRVLITGSSNFDIISYVSQQEIVLISDDRRMVHDVVEKVVRPDIRRSIPYRGPVRPLLGWWAWLVLRLTSFLAAGGR